MSVGPNVTNEDASQAENCLDLCINDESDGLLWWNVIRAGANTDLDGSGCVGLCINVFTACFILDELFSCRGGLCCSSEGPEHGLDVCLLFEHLHSSVDFNHEASG